MGIRIIGTVSEVLRKSLYGSRSVEESTGTSDKKRENDGGRSGIACSAADGGKIALSRNQIVKSDEYDLTSLRPSLTKQDNYGRFLDKGIDQKGAFSVGKTTFLLDIDTQLVQDQYTIDKVALDATSSAINKYREAQAYRFRNISTLEVYA